MTERQVAKILKEMGVRPETVSFYVHEEDPDVSTEPFFGWCDISNVQGNVATCSALDTGGNVVFFDVGEWLIGGALGSLAGAF